MLRPAATLPFSGRFGHRWRFGRGVFSIMVVMVLVTTMVTPLFLRLLFPKRPAPPSGEEVFESVAHPETE